MAALAGTETVNLNTASGSVISAAAATVSKIALLASANPARTVTPVANGSGTTLTATMLIGGIISRTGTAAAFTDTTDTATAIIAALPTDTPLSSSWLIFIRNLTPFTQTLANGSGVLLNGEIVVPPNSLWIAQAFYTSSAVITITGLGSIPISLGVLEINTAISNGSGTTLTAAGIVGGVITRSGPSAPFTDTTDTAANIIAALPNPSVGQPWELTLVNSTAVAETLSAGSGVTLSGLSSPIPANSTGRFLVTYTGSNAVTMALISVGYDAAGGSQPSTMLTGFGSGTATFLASGLINRQISSSGVNPGTTGADNVLAVYTLPANSLDGVSNRGLSITAHGSFGATGNNKRIKIIFNPVSATAGSTVGGGGTTIADTGTVTTSGGGWLLSAEVFKYGAVGSNTQISTSDGNIAGTVHLGVSAPVLATATESGAILIAVTGNATTSTSDIAFNLLRILARN